MWSRQHWDNCVRGEDQSPPQGHPASALERNLPPPILLLYRLSATTCGNIETSRETTKEKKKGKGKEQERGVVGIIHGTLETGVGCAASSRACRSSVYLRSSSRPLAMNRTAPCSTIPLHTWSLHAVCNQPSSGIPNAFRYSSRHSHEHFTFRPRFFSTRPTFLNVPCNRRFGYLWLRVY